MGSFRTTSSGWFACVAVGIAACLPLLLGLEGPWETLRFLFGLIAFVTGPGLFVACLLRVRLRGLELVLLATTLGIAASNLVYLVTGFLDLRSLYLSWPAGANVGLLLLLTRRGRSGLGSRVAVRPQLCFLIACIAIVMPVSSLPHLASDFVVQPDGATLVSRMHFHDAVLHASAANELTHTLPPEAPFLSGTPLTYHYGMDLLTAVFRDFLAIETPDLCLRFLPVLYLALCLAAAFAFARRWLGSASLGLMTACLVILGGDLSFVPGLLTGSSLPWAERFFQTPTVHSLYSVNPMGLGLALLFAGLFCLLQAWRQPGRRLLWLSLAGVHFGVMGTVKVFALLHIIAALLLGAALELRRPDRFLSRALGVILLAAMLVMAPALLLHERGTAIEIQPTAFTGYLGTMLEQTQLDGFPGFRAAAELFSSRRVGLPGVLGAVLLALPLFLVGSLGVRAVALPAMARTLFSWRTAPPLSVLLVLFVATGYLLTLGLRISPIDRPDSYNNSVWFAVQAKYVAWVVAGETVRRAVRSRSRWSSLALIALLVLLALPSSGQALYALSRTVGFIGVPQGAREVTAYVAREVPTGAVVLAEHRPLRIALLASTSVRLPFFDLMFAKAFLRERELRERQSDMRAFWLAWEEGRFRGDLASKYRVDYVVSRRPLPGRRASFENGSYQLYRIAP